MIAVCDAFSAMTGGRPYRAALSREEALAELRRCAGGQFDPAVVAVVCGLVERGEDLELEREAAQVVTSVGALLQTSPEST